MVILMYYNENVDLQFSRLRRHLNYQGKNFRTVYAFASPEQYRACHEGGGGGAFNAQFLVKLNLNFTFFVFGHQ